jgi:septum formation protein
MEKLPTCIHLASSSPRRRELLTQIGVKFDVLFFRAPPRDDEDISEAALPNEAPIDYVVRVARAKAEGALRRSQWRNLPERPILAADTTLDLDGEIIGKPQNEQHARETLRKLSGRSHRVLTAVVVAHHGEMEHRLSISSVTFKALDEEEITRYLATGEPFDKAGAYGIQGFAAAFITEICGSYSGIMGLPLFETAELLRHFGLRA